MRKDILRKKLIHKRITYLFQWNQSNHKALASQPSLHDFASSLWSFLERVYNDDIPHQFFWSNEFRRASTMRLASVSKSGEAGLVHKLAREGLVSMESYSNLLNLVRKVVSSSTSHSSVLSFLLNYDPFAVASEIPVYSEELKMTGHIDLLRMTSEGAIQVLDFKPGLRDADLIIASPQVAAYGVLLGKLVPVIKNHIECTLFNTKESLSFKPDLVNRLGESGVQQVLLGKGRGGQLYQSTLDSLL
ncbi:MAG: PD-(D/E)XK nuclease family protein [Promethearchaeati archaeon SRVP18_Atabeyarchaeia-1]